MNRKKSVKIKRKLWDAADMEEALAVVRQKEMSIRQASRTYHVPLTTLSDRVAGRVTRETPGPDPVLTKAEESRLAKWILSMNAIGHGPTRVQVCETVKQILDANKRSNPFIDNLPGRGWYASFLKRHPEVRESYWSSTSPSTPTVSRKKLDKWFKEYQGTVSRLGLAEKPHLIWSCGETTFPFEPALEWATSPSSSLFHETEKEGSRKSKKRISTICAISAAGAVIPPAHVFQKPTYTSRRDAVPCAYYMQHPSGCTDSQLFQLWLTGHFTEHAPNERPILILFDGYSPSVDRATRVKALDNEVEFFCLPPHLVRQPIDVGLFNSLKMDWWRNVEDYKSERGHKRIRAKGFPSLFKNSWEDSVRLINIFDGFRKTGIFPLDRDLLGTVHLRQTSLSSNSKGSSPMSIDSLLTSKTIVLKALEEEIPRIQVELFEKRFTRGYRSHDPLYLTWKNLKMKVQSTSGAVGESSSGSSCSSDEESSSSSEEGIEDGRELASKEIPPSIVPQSIETAAYEEVRSQAYNNVIRIKRARKETHVSRKDEEDVSDFGNDAAETSYLRVADGGDIPQIDVSIQTLRSQAADAAPSIDGIPPKVVSEDGTLLPSSPADGSSLHSAGDGLCIVAPSAASHSDWRRRWEQDAGEEAVRVEQGKVNVVPVMSSLQLSDHDTIVRQNGASHFSVTSASSTITENEAADALVTVSMLDPESVNVSDFQVASAIEVIS